MTIDRTTLVTVLVTLDQLSELEAGAKERVAFWERRIREAEAGNNLLVAAAYKAILLGCQQGLDALVYAAPRRLLAEDTKYGPYSELRELSHQMTQHLHSTDASRRTDGKAVRP